MFIIKHKFIFICISLVLTVLGVLSMVVFGLKLGIDFRGGSLLEVTYENTRPDIVEVTTTLAPLGLREVVQTTGENGLLIKTATLIESERQMLVSNLESARPDVEVVNFTSIGPSVGKELKHKSIVALVLVSLAIVFFITYAFRKVSEPVASWKYGVIAIGTLLHDCIIPMGIFAVIAQVKGIEIDTLFIVAILTILGLSVSDTIVVFDRIRENLRKNIEEKNNEIFEVTVGKSLTQTYTRSINTSFTVILALLALVFFGPASTRYFAIMLTAGMFFGTYSSIFLASPLLTVWQHYTERKNTN